MLLANFYHLKNSNGLFYYGVDYLQSSGFSNARVLVRPALKGATQRMLPAATVVECGPLRVLLEATRCALRRGFIFTPTSHPLPLISRQMIVLHDSFPFVGRLGRLKRTLLAYSLGSSRCLVGYINHADARAFLERLPVAADRLVFAPNKFPSPAALVRRRAPGSGKTIVGLLGTDSAKKNYAALFDQVRQDGLQDQFTFHVFGHASQYFLALAAAFQDLSIVLVGSDSNSMDGFLCGVDVVASVADNEGFGRPVAYALMAGVPCVLIDCPVFREFFDKMAHFAPNVAGVVALLRQVSHLPSSTGVEFAPPGAVVAAFDRTVTLLGAKGKLS